MEINLGRNFHENQFGQQISIRVSWFAEVQLVGAGGSAVDLLLTFAPTHLLQEGTLLQQEGTHLLQEGTHLLQEGTLHTRSATLHTHTHLLTSPNPPPASSTSALHTAHTAPTHSGQIK